MSLGTIIKRGISTFQTLQQIKKFYKNVSLEKFENPPFKEHKYVIKLDGKQVKTPNKHILATPTEPLGLAVAAEFLTQKEFLKPATMPLFSLARTAIDMDHDKNLREHLELALVNFFETDTIWYREPEEGVLLKLQKENLDPIVKYINEQLGTNMETKSAFDSNKLTDKQKEQLLQYFRQYNNWKLLSLEYAASTLKSTSLAIALMNGRVGIEEALDLSRLEENYQQTIYGIVEGDHDVDENTSLMMVAASKNFYTLSH